MSGGDPWLSLLCLCVCMCVSICLSMYFCQCSFPVLTSGFLPVAFSGVKTPGLRPVPNPTGDPNPFGSARSPEKPQKPPPVLLQDQEQEHLFCCFSPARGQGWSLCGGQEKSGLSSRVPCHLSRMNTGRRSSSPT